jgi:hypothetical protein
MEFDICGELPTRLVDHPFYGSVLDALGDVVALCQDVYSLDRENFYGTDINVVLSVHSAQGGSLDDAVETVKTMVAERLQQYETAKAGLPDLCDELELPEAVRNNVIDFLGHYGTALRGNVDWGRTSARYADMAAQPPAATNH